jgi:ADP-ribose pyrophosphatase YjhB (NUDIX family)
MAPPDGTREVQPGLPAREYPARPIVGVGGVVFIDGRVLLIRRRYEPLAGRWSIPGGAVEIGETLAEGLVREMKEETGLDVEVGPVLDVFDRISRDPDGRVRYHYVLADFLCRVFAGQPAAGSDVSEVVLADPSDLAPYDLTPKTLAVIDAARRLAAPASDPRVGSA